jgi:hypothetical protein
MDKKRFFMIAAAGLLASRPAIATLSEIDAKLDKALDNARAEQRTEQPLALDSLGQSMDDELPARMY